MRTIYSFLRGILLLLLAGCTDPYLPEVIQSPPQSLVVDGFINPVGITTFKLSRSYAIGSKSGAPLESKATVYVEEENGPRFQLAEAPVGTYTSTAQTLNATRRYRLHLTTQSGQEYASDFVAVKITPAIDQLDWRPESTGVNFYINTHDAANATHYYRWEYTETWEIVPIYAPTIEYVNQVIQPIVTRYPTLCWGNAPSTTVQLAKTTSLAQDVVSDFLLRRLPRNSERLRSRYSIMVQQYALTREEHDYWALLAKNTESIGSLFDAQPVQLTGNVRCLSSSREAVLGYVGAHSVVKQRLFIARNDLPAGWEVLNGYEDCYPPDTVYIDRPFTPAPPSLDDKLALIFAAFHNPQVYVPIRPLSGSLPETSGFLGKSRDCVDCRTRGTITKPSFWP